VTLRSKRPPPPSVRINDPSQVVRQGVRRAYFNDLYHYLLTASWSRLTGMIAGLYLLLNALFAGLYLLGGDCIVGAEPGSFSDAFFFSVQTFSTIGYGGLAPRGVYANLVVTIEAFVGLLLVAMASGLMFAKFARPTSRVLFADKIVITRRNGRPYLMLRMANDRGNDVVEASLRVCVLKTEITKEGSTMRRLHDLKLERSETPLFVITWMALHAIDESSPLYGEDATSMREGDVRIIVTLTGIDGTISQTIHARRIYLADEVIWGARYLDVLSNRPDGQLVLDYTRFHEVEPEPASEDSESAAA